MPPLLPPPPPPPPPLLLLLLYLCIAAAGMKSVNYIPTTIDDGLEGRQGAAGQVRRDDPAPGQYLQVWTGLRPEVEHGWCNAWHAYAEKGRGRPV